MDKLQWIRDLVRVEQTMEESGMLDIHSDIDPEQLLLEESHDFLQNLKSAFVEAGTSFNQLKTSAVGRIKIYGIANSQADFMLFRNGLKLIFSLKKPGQISIRFQFVGSSFLGASQAEKDPRNNVDEDLITSRWGAFGDLTWVYRDMPVRIDYLVRYYMTRFIRESAK